jgi:hypothetical protein
MKKIILVTLLIFFILGSFSFAEDDKENYSGKRSLFKGKYHGRRLDFPFYGLRFGKYNDINARILLSETGNEYSSGGNRYEHSFLGIGVEKRFNSFGNLYFKLAADYLMYTVHNVSNLSSYGGNGVVGSLAIGIDFIRSDKGVLSGELLTSAGRIGLKNEGVMVETIDFTSREGYEFSLRFSF